MTNKIDEIKAEALTDEELEAVNGGLLLKVAKQKDDDLTYKNSAIIRAEIKSPLQNQ